MKLLHTLESVELAIRWLIGQTWFLLTLGEQPYPKTHRNFDPERENTRA